MASEWSISTPVQARPTQIILYYVLKKPLNKQTAENHMKKQQNLSIFVGYSSELWLGIGNNPN